MKKNFFYIYIDQPFAKQQMEMTFPKKFKLKNYSLKIISTQNMNFKKEDIRDYYKKTPKKDIPKKVKYFNSLSEFENFLKKVKKNDLFFIRERSFISNHLKDYDLELIKKYNIKTISFKYDPYIRSNFKKKFFLNLFRMLAFYIRKILNSLVKHHNYSPSYQISSGEVEKQNFYKKNSNKTIYLDCPSAWIKFYKKNLKKEKFITYVDENIYFSRDQYLFNRSYKKTSDPNLFIKNLNEFFLMIEQKYNSKIIIACSKKFKYKKNPFNGRNIIYGKTHDLISKSKIVIGHRSDVLYQALYSKTPVILVKHKTFSLLRNLYIDFKSVNIFNKQSYYIEDYLKKNKNLDDKIDKFFYKKIFVNYFLSKNLKKENFSNTLSKEIINLNKKKIYA